MRVGVIGVGSMGQNHARVLRGIADLVGVVDSDIGRARSVATRFGTKAFASVDELLQEGVDCVTLATPTEMHYEQARSIVSKGIHLLVEKPMCKTSREAADIVELAEECGVTLAAGHIERHNPVVKLVKEAAGQGDFGDVITISARRVSSYPSRIRDVGVIHDLGSHDIDVAIYLTASDVSSVYAVGGCTAITPFEDHASILLTFSNGMTAFIEVNWLTPFKVRRFWLTCSKKFVEVDYINQTMEVSSSRFVEIDTSNLYHIPLEYAVRRTSLKKQEPLRNELMDFLDAVREKRSPLVTGREGERVIRVCEAAVRSTREGVPVRLG